MVKTHKNRDISVCLFWKAAFRFLPFSLVASFHLLLPSGCGMEKAVLSKYSLIIILFLFVVGVESWNFHWIVLCVVVWCLFLIRFSFFGDFLYLGLGSGDFLLSSFFVYHNVLNLCSALMNFTEKKKIPANPYLNRNHYREI